MKASCAPYLYEHFGQYFLGHAFVVIQFLLERAEQALNTSVLPRTTWLGALVADAQHVQETLHVFGRKASRVIGTNSLGLAVSAYCYKQVPSQGVEILVGDCVQCYRHSCAMVKNTQYRGDVSTIRFLPHKSTSQTALRSQGQG